MKLPLLQRTPVSYREVHPGSYRFRYCGPINWPGRIRSGQSWHVCSPRDLIHKRLLLCITLRLDLIQLLHELSICSVRSLLLLTSRFLRSLILQPLRHVRTVTRFQITKFRLVFTLCCKSLIRKITKCCSLFACKCIEFLTVLLTKQSSLISCDSRGQDTLESEPVHQLFHCQILALKSIV